MNENYNNQCQKQSDQNYEIGCGCAGILEFIDKLLSDVQRLADESQELFQKSDYLVEKTEDTVEEALRTINSANIRLTAATDLITANEATCFCEGTPCTQLDSITALIGTGGTIPTSLTDILTILTGLTVVGGPLDLLRTAYEQLELLLPQYEQCISCRFCQDCSCNGSARATCNCPARTTCNCPRI